MDNLKREILAGLTEEQWLVERAKDLTSSDIAALFGVSPYLTHYDLWHRKADGLVPEFTMTDRVTWGNRMEETIARGIAEDQGWEVRPMKEYIRIPSLRVGSSFDFAVIDGAGDHVQRDANGLLPAPRAILEIKAVDWLEHKNKWLIYDDGSIEAPLHIELQVQHQMLVAGMRKAYIGVLIGGNQVQLLEREANDDYHATILAKAAGFWSSVDAGEEPPPVLPDDLDTIQRLYNFGDPGKYRDATGDEAIADACTDYLTASADEKAAKGLKDTAKAKLLMAIGENSKVTCGLFTVSAGMVAAADISYHRSEYRNFRVSQRKSK